MAYDSLASAQMIRVTVVDVDDSGPQQLVHATGLLGQDIGRMVRVQHFGESSVPPAGSEGHALTVGGSADRSFVLGREHPAYRPVNAPIGAKALYDQAGNIIKMYNAAGVDMNFSTNPWTVECGPVTITASGDVYIKATGHKVYLGNPPYSAVVTVLGPSTQVFAGL